MKNTSNIHITQPLRLGLKLHSFAQPSSTIQPLSQIFATQQLPNKKNQGTKLLCEKKIIDIINQIENQSKIILKLTLL